MTMIDLGTNGAKVQSWRQANPRDVLRKLIDATPTATKEKLLAAFRDEVLGERGIEYLDSIIEYWFANNYHSLVERPQRQKPHVMQNKVGQIKAAINDRIQENVRIVLLDMILPNGKPLSECTGAECAHLGDKLGGWLSKIANKMKPSEVVGDVLSEEQLRALYDADAPARNAPKKRVATGAQSITAIVFGDPMPGRSALDKE